MPEAHSAIYFLLVKAGRRLSTNPSVATLHRWASKGARGVILKTYLIGGRRYTTAEDLEDFVARLNEPRGRDVPPTSKREQERKAVAAVRAEAIFGPISHDDEPTARRGKGQRRPRKPCGDK